MSDRPSNFYSGLVAKLYEPLAGSPADPEQFVRFVKNNGTPALELACGAGHPMLQLIAQELEVWGIDSSIDMLDQCEEKADDLGLKVNLKLQLMQALELHQQFACCYIAGASFSLIESLDDATETLTRVYKHLTPAGAFLLSVFRPKLESQPGAEISRIRQDGSKISVQSIGQKEVEDQQLIITRLRYSVRHTKKERETVERDWVVRWYQHRQLSSMLESAGFVVGSAYNFDGKKADSRSCNFSIVARKPS